MIWPRLIMRGIKCHKTKYVIHCMIYQTICRWEFPKKFQLTIILLTETFSGHYWKKKQTKHHTGYCYWCQDSDSFESAALDKIFLAYQCPFFGNIYINVLKKFCLPGRQLVTCMLAQWVTSLTLDYHNHSCCHCCRLRNFETILSTKAIPSLAILASFP